MDIDHHDDWSGFHVGQLSPDQYAAFKILVDRYFAGYNDPGLIAVGHEEYVRLAKSILHSSIEGLLKRSITRRATKKLMSAKHVNTRPGSALIRTNEEGQLCRDRRHSFNRKISLITSEMSIREGL
ncbi:MAG: hypothetical protein KIT57_12265 [Blastocatellales bacterium]|nr:hypothetical protein [Blastocatellales bacterium]